jgi:D-sedoheptulose 7-phosphate isomerase
MNNIMGLESFEKYRKSLLSTLGELKGQEWGKAANLILDCIKSDTPIFIIGNGGSAMTANHFEIDWQKGVREISGTSLKARSLCTNSGLIMAIGNDVSFDKIFVDQLKYHSSNNFLLIAISGSGNSENVIQAVEYTRSIGAGHIALVGFDGGRLLNISDNHILVPINNMQIVEDIHSMFGHFVLHFIKDNYGK